MCKGIIKVFICFQFLSVKPKPHQTYPLLVSAFPAATHARRHFYKMYPYSYKPFFFVSQKSIQVKFSTVDQTVEKSLKCILTKFEISKSRRSQGIAVQS